MFSACFSAPACLRVKKHPLHSMQSRPVRNSRRPVMYRTCQPRFPLFSITSRSERPKLPGCRAIPECRSGLMHCPPARSAAPAAPGSCNRVADWPLRVDRWGGPPGPPAGRPARRPAAGEGAPPHRSTERGTEPPLCERRVGPLSECPTVWELADARSTLRRQGGSIPANVSNGRFPTKWPGNLRELAVEPE